MTSTLLIGLAIGVVVGAVVSYVLSRYLSDKTVQSARKQAEEILSEAKAAAELHRQEIELAAKEEQVRLREELEQETRRRRRELQRQEERLQKRQEQLDKRQEELDARDKNLQKRQSKLDKRAAELDQIEAKQVEELQRLSGLSKEEAKQLLVEAMRAEARQDMARVIREVEAEAREEADRRARKIIALAIQRLASEQVAETTVASVPLPSDDMKGRIIGRQGRNIRAIEQATGVDLIVDDTPEAIIISSHDPIRREVARIALSKLVMDGRIQPSRIEKEVQKAQAEVEQSIWEAGEQAVYETGLQGLHPEIIRLVGRLKYRTSYGQNQLYHAIETAHLAGILAAELGADVRTAKMGGLLHDLGKAVTHEVEGPHALVGADIAKRFGVPPKVVNCIAAHHHEVEPECIEAILVEAADAISGARPGARREALETYLRRVTALEDLANSFQGVEQAYAIQAGREIRIVVKPNVVDDYEAVVLSREIAKKVEETLEYPGQIKVTVIRETRAVEYAK
ncbi:MAG: ribonuclease Y [Caldilineales bacterium]|nr:ribonuclease Y [Caldilineales bacterium]MDW8318758.1 ribonuclease Y [Anaerolineae bacterium]